MENSTPNGGERARLLREVEVLRREIQLELKLRDNTMMAIREDVADMRDAQRWVLRAAATQLLVVIGGAVTAAIVGLA